MAKSLFLLFISSLIAIMSPVALTATDEVVLAGVSDARAVETVPLPEPEAEPAASAAASAVAGAPAAGVAYSAGTYTAPVVMTPNYTVTNYVGSKQEYVNTYANLSYSAIYKYNKLIYGHNSYNLLGSLGSRYVGEIINITEGGVARSYRVAAVVVYDKTADGNLNGDPRLMGQIANTAMGHTVAMMTCAGVNYGNGDASQRLVVYADAV